MSDIIPHNNQSTGVENPLDPIESSKGIDLLNFLKTTQGKLFDILKADLVNKEVPSEEIDPLLIRIGNQVGRLGLYYIQAVKNYNIKE